MSDAFICDAIRTPVGRYGGGLSQVRTDDLGAVPIKALMDRNGSVDWEQVDDVYYGNANQAGEDNRNVARMSGLLAGLPLEVGGATVNRLCGSGMEATAQAARAIAAGEVALEDFDIERQAVALEFGRLQHHHGIDHVRLGFSEHRHRGAGSILGETVRRGGAHRVS